VVKLEIYWVSPSPWKNLKYVPTDLSDEVGFVDTDKILKHYIADLLTPSFFLYCALLESISMLDCNIGWQLSFSGYCVIIICKRF